MSTHACIRVFGEDFPKGILLHTTHTGMDLPKIVKEAPSLILKVRTYIKSESDLDIALDCDGSLYDWLFYPQCVCSLLIAARPLMLCHVSQDEMKHIAKWSGADNPWILRIEDDVWFLTDPKTKQITEFDPVKLIKEGITDAKRQEELPKV